MTYCKVGIILSYSLDANSIILVLFASQFPPPRVRTIFFTSSRVGKYPEGHEVSSIIPDENIGKVYDAKGIVETRVALCVAECKVMATWKPSIQVLGQELVNNGIAESIVTVHWGNVC